MNTLKGMRIVESPIIQEVPKLQLSANFTACSEAVKSSMNNWLRERFGTYMPAYVIGRDTVVMHPTHAAMLRAGVKGGAA